MVEEDQATGRVAAVYAQALEKAPFVPSLLKSLALCPPYLVLAWEQAATVLPRPELAQAVEGLAAGVAGAAVPPPTPGDRELLGGFVEPLGRMLLLACGLLVALEDGLSGRPPAVLRPLEPPDSRLERNVPTLDELPDHAAVFGRIRASLDTPIVNSIWRRAAGEGRLEEMWEHLEPQAAATRPRADALQAEAIASAGDLPWEAVADSAALRSAGIEDAAPGMAEVLRAYAETLPRVLALVASSGRS